MTDQPGNPPEQRLPVPREPSEVAPTERFSAPVQAHTAGLTSERAAKIVRQSGNARWVAFLAVTLVTIFVIGYYFYELGIPGIPDSSRMTKEAAAQQVTDVQRGYKLFEANCSRCHGAQGQGGIGPVLNDQAKLLTHLTPQYITTVLTVGGRYVCGDPSSLMLAWLEPKGPLNYRQVEELVTFLRAPNTLTYTAVDATTGARGRRDRLARRQLRHAAHRHAGARLLEGRLHRRRRRVGRRHRPRPARHPAACPARPSRWS